MDAEEFFKRINDANPSATWSVTTIRVGKVTEIGTEISWEWDITKEGQKSYDYIIPEGAMRDDVLIERHLETCKEKMDQM